MPALAAPTAADRRQALIGIACIVLAYFLFAFHDASIKWLVVTLTVWQMMFFRSATILTGCLVIGRGRLVGDALRSRHKRMYALLAATLLCAWQCYYTAAQWLQLGELTTIYFATPIIAILLAQPILGERATPLAWAAAVLGFAGVVVAVGPGDLGFSGPVLLVLVSSVLWAFSQIIMRKLGRGEAPDPVMVQMVYTNGIYVLVAGASLPFVWHAMDPLQWALVMSLGVLGGGAQFSMIQGFRRAAPAVLAPFQYTALLWAFVLGYAIWGDVPRDAVFVGAAMIVAAGAMILVSQRRR